MKIFYKKSFWFQSKASHYSIASISLCSTLAFYIEVTICVLSLHLSYDTWTITSPHRIMMLEIYIFHSIEWPKPIWRNWQNCSDPPNKNLLLTWGWAWPEALMFSAFLNISLHFPIFLCISLHFAAFYISYFWTIWRSLPSSYGCHFLKGCCRACCLNNGHSIKVIQRMFFGVCFVLGVFSIKAFRRLHLPHGTSITTNVQEMLLLNNLTMHLCIAGLDRQSPGGPSHTLYVDTKRNAFGSHVLPMH